MFTVLIAESDNQIKEAIRQMEQDLRILVVPNLKRALEVAELEAIDIFMLDIGLANEQGLELVKKLRESYPHQPIIIGSSEKELSFPKLVHDEIENLAFLEKPYSLDKLAMKIKRALDIAEHQTSKKLIVEQKGFTHLFEIQDIMYIGSIKGAKELEIVLYDRVKKRLINKTLKGITLNKLMADLPYKKALIRCHNSYIVNPQMIVKWNHSPMQGNSVILKYQDIEIPIGKTYRNNIHF